MYPARSVQALTCCILLFAAGCKKSPHPAIRERLLGSWKDYANGGGESYQYFRGEPVADSIETTLLFRDDDSVLLRKRNSLLAASFWLDGRSLYVDSWRYAEIMSLDDTMMLFRFDPEMPPFRALAGVPPAIATTGRLISLRNYNDNSTFAAELHLHSS